MPAPGPPKSLAERIDDLMQPFSPARELLESIPGRRGSPIWWRVERRLSVSTKCMERQTAGAGAAQAASLIPIVLAQG